MAATDPMPILRALAAELSQYGGGDGSAAAGGSGAARSAAAPAGSAAAAAAASTLFLGCRVAIVQLPAEAPATAAAAASAGGGAAAAAAGEAGAAVPPSGDGQDGRLPQGGRATAGAAPDALTACIARRLAAQVWGFFLEGIFPFAGCWPAKDTAHTGVCRSMAAALLPSRRQSQARLSLSM